MPEHNHLDNQEKGAAVAAGTTLEEAAQLMAQGMVQFCAVQDEEGKLLGEMDVYRLLGAMIEPKPGIATLGQLLAQAAPERAPAPAINPPAWANLLDGADLSKKDMAEVLSSAPCGLMVVGAAGLICYLNPKGARMLATPEKEARGLPVSLFIKDDTVLAMVAEHQPFFGRPLKQHERTFLISGSSTQGDEAMVLVFHELEEMQRQWDEMKRLGDELTSLIENSHDGIIITDDKRVLRVNASFGRITGLAPSLILGCKITELDAERHVCLAALQEVVRLARYHKKSFTVRRSLKSGNEIFVTGSPVFDRHGQVARVVLNIRDITELKNLGDQLKRITVLCQEQSSPEQPQMLKELVAESPVMQRLLDLVLRVAHVDSTVLLQGESGVGKDVMARLIHQLSSRNEKPLISVNCGAIPETLLESEFFGYEKGAFTSAARGGKPGLFEQANGGILFLDEVGELPLNLQVKLLRVLQDQRCRRLGGVRNIQLDVRFLAATNTDLRKMVAEGTFREDLFYRLYVVPIQIPPLRERREDILPMALSFLAHFNKKYGVTRSLGHDLMRFLETYEWPGNVRELQNVIERVVVTADAEVLEARHLPQSIYDEKEGEWGQMWAPGTMNLRQAREKMESHLIAQALSKAGNTRGAAKLLGVNHSTVVRKAQRYGLDVREAAAQA